MNLLDTETTYFEKNAETILNSLGVTKAQMAKAMGVAPQNVNKMLGTKNALTLAKISQFLNIPIEVLINGQEAKNADIHGCIYVEGTPHLVNSKEDIERLLAEL